MTGAAERVSFVARWRSVGPAIALLAGLAVGCNDAGIRCPPDPPSICELPLLKVQSSGKTTDAVAIIVTGDGGWAKLVRHVGRYLAHEGIPVVALSAPRYFWTPRTPEESAEALEQIIRWFVNTSGHRRVLLVGYSRGADVLPFMVSRLPPDLKALVDLTVLIGPEPRISFRFRLTDWIPELVPAGLPVLPEILKLSHLRLLCIYGLQENDSLCPTLHSSAVLLAPFPGDHHFNGAYDRIAERVMQEFSSATRSLDGSDRGVGASALSD